jgi:hypothetical protein
MNGGMLAHEDAMPSSREREAYAYATRLSGRFPLCLQECREEVKVNRYGLK